MLNIPEQIIESVQFDARQFEDRLKYLSELMIKEKVSDFPIFVVHREAFIQLGRPYIIAEKEESQWSFNASHLDEFVAKKLILEEKIAVFKSSYKIPQKFACLFIISGEKDAGFAYYPYH